MLTSPHTLIVIEKLYGEHLITEVRHSLNEILLLRSKLRERFKQPDYDIQIFAPVRILTIDEIEARPVWEGPYYSPEYKEIKSK